MIDYVAGVVDSRGHISLVGRRELLTPRIRVTTRRLVLLDYLAKVTGTTLHTDERGYERRACAEHCHNRHQHIDRQSAYWNVDATRAVIVLFNVLPHLVCQREVAYSALTYAHQSWPTSPRTEIIEQMRRSGWVIPSRTDLPIGEPHGALPAPALEGLPDVQGLQVP